MKAIVCEKYGSPEVLQLQEVAKPSPKENEVLVKVHAASVTTADTMIRQGTPFYGRLFIGLFKPKHSIMGTGFAGVVEAIGEHVSQFEMGQEVFGETALGFGANAEYVCVPEDGVITTKSSNITFQEAAPICDGALTSFNFLKELAKVKLGQKVLIIGASGSLGTAAVQLAKAFGAEVTGVCSSRNVALVKSLGADHVIDYLKEDFRLNNSTYDIIYDTVGKSSFSQCKSSLSVNGLYLSPVLNMRLLFQMIWTTKSKKKALFEATGLKKPVELREMLKELKLMIENNLFSTVVGREYQLEQIAEAHRYIDRGHKVGNVVVNIIHNESDLVSTEDEQKVLTNTH
ncbi:NAD(P)-dependent alcohol dehydrogenase [Flammeovirgaceae bacterium SG7u.111]|nr:NAD(P)-dependent alcohol dehydrogenase [Flammeovirgaceae bacterium SG7u.132]WPO33317.1 NAD(P)-dependent alcohol dehydrogenase [Flammeovirgaceae bacterium SG7u.111]